MKNEFSGDFRKDAIDLIDKIKNIFCNWRREDSLIPLANTLSFIFIGDEIAKLNKCVEKLSITLIEDHRQIMEMKESNLTQTRIIDLVDRLDVLENGLKQIIDWSRAYPLEMFPEPDMKKARELLRAGGIPLDEVTASAMRHVITRVAEIATKAIDPAERESDERESGRKN